MNKILLRFRDDQKGSMAIELVMVVPILVWALLSTFVYFDLFRTEANANRAALTIADMFSREQDAIDPVYLDGTRELLRSLTFSEDNPGFRVTVYRFDATNDRYDLVWSRNRGMTPDLTNDSLLTLRAEGKLPLLAEGDSAILVETLTDYSAPFSIGLGPFTGTDLDDVTFDTFTVIRPRFTTQLCWDVSPTDAIPPAC